MNYIVSYINRKQSLKGTVKQKVAIYSPKTTALSSQPTTMNSGPSEDGHTS